MRIPPYYYDCACPSAYLGSRCAETYFGEIGVEIDFRSIHLATAREPASGPMPESGPRKSKWSMGDLMA